MRTKMHVLAVVVMVAVLAVAGCSAGTRNLSYERGWGQVMRLNNPVTATVISSVDARPYARTYPKQIIKNVNYSDEVTYDINDRTVTDVFDEALAEELKQHGVRLVATEGVGGPLDKTTFEAVKEQLQRDYPDVQAAIGYDILDFMASTKRNFLTYDITISVRVRIYALNVTTGKLITMEYNTEWTDWSLTLDRDDLIGELDKAVVDVMKNTIRDNLSLRDLLVSASGA